MPAQITNLFSILLLFIPMSLFMIREHLSVFCVPCGVSNLISFAVGGDARRPDRVSAMCWSSSDPVLYVGHASGKVNLHRLNVRTHSFVVH